MIEYDPSMFLTQSIIQAESKRRAELAHTSALAQAAWSAAEAMDELRKPCESCRLARVVEGETAVNGKLINSVKSNVKPSRKPFIAIVIIIMYMYVEFVYA